MKVKHLIRELQKCDPEIEVKLANPMCCCTGEFCDDIYDAVSVWLYNGKDFAVIDNYQCDEDEGYVRPGGRNEPLGGNDAVD